MQLIVFVAAWFVFTAGPGIAITGRLTRDLDPLRRIIVALGAGTAVTPVIINVLGRVGMISVFPYLTVALGGFGLWLTRRGSTPPTERTSRGDLAACAALAILAAGLGYAVFAQRIDVSPEAIAVYGEYDSADLSYYAGEASEASHTVPPMAFYYSGHKLNAAYFPHLVLAMVHRFAAVPVLTMYFQYAWPVFLVLSALTGFVLVRSLTSRAVAVLAVALIIAASDFSYLAAWYLPSVQTSGAWDYILWPTNFLSPTMQILYFNTWGPSLPLFFTVLYAIVRGLQTRQRGWIVVGALLLAILFEFKPFAYVVLMAALGAATVFSGRDVLARFHFIGTALLAVVFTIPFLVAAFTLDPEDRRTRLVIEFFPLVKRMLIKVGLDDALPAAVEAVVPWGPLRNPIVLSLATVAFLAIGVGLRWVGAPGVWRAIRRRGLGNVADAASWSFLGWSVIAGVAIPFVLATDPYVDTLNFYVTGLYVMWIFAAMALVSFARTHRSIGVVVAGLAIAAVLPSSAHYLERRWNDRDRPPRVDLSGAEIRIAEYLRNKTDPESTVVLHDRPLSPSLTTIVSERRIVLGWDVTYSAVGGQARLRDVNRFYASLDGNPEGAWETVTRYQVTHVIVRDDDRVHPAILGRMHLLMQFPGAALYSVPTPPQP